MDQETGGWMVAHSGLDWEDKTGKKKKKGKGSSVWLPVV